MTLWPHIRGRLSNFHRQGSLPDIYLFSTPRSGSTFLMELLQTQKGMKIYNEPFSLRKEIAQHELGVSDWQALTQMENREIAFKRYITKLKENRLPELNRPLYWRTGCWRTTRHTFKILHVGEDMLSWFEHTFDGQILILLRHPIATALSHEHHPRLPYLLNQPGMRTYFTHRQIDESHALIKNGSPFEHGILDWCLQTSPLLQSAKGKNWPIISYEDLTAHPEASMAYLQDKLTLDPVPNLKDLIANPSGSTVQSDKSTQDFFKQGQDSGQRYFLIEKWRNKVTPEQEARAFDILDIFGITAYQPGNLFPNDALRILH